MKSQTGRKRRTRTMRLSILAVIGGSLGMSPTPLAMGQIQQGPPGSIHQASGNALPSFEVASIRPVPTDQAGFTSISPYGIPRFMAKNISLQMLIELAYGVDGQYIEGQTKGTDSTLYDIDAVPEDELPLSYERLKPLLQQLLQDRFHLVIHQVTKDISGLALETFKAAPKLKLSNKPKVGSYFTNNEIRLPSGSLTQLAAILSHLVNCPVEDKTGISGNFDITLRYAPDSSTDSNFPSIYTALKENLGLELKPQKVPVQMLVIDHVDKAPTEN